MIEINSWIENFLKNLESVFGERAFFVGLQGSYSRGEATESSDVDMVVILDELLPLDIKKYNDMLDSLSHRELICGFLAGKKELFSWEPFDLFSLYYDTKALKGSLDELLSLIDDEAVKRSVKVGACNVYHSCVHNMLYEKSEEILRGLYKSALFLVRAIVFLQTGKYLRAQKDLQEAVLPRERVIVDTFLSIKNGGAVDFDKMSEALFEWAKTLIDNCVEL